jgi:uncharacterized protein involved in exopolysaccharide biosynthesis
MNRTLEAIFRHPMRLLILIVLPPLIGVGLAYFLIPRSYQSTASLWAYQPFQQITPSGVVGNQFATPAQTQATALTEFLNSRTFVLSVVKGINIAPTLSLGSDVLADPQKRDNAIFIEISKNVLATSVDYNLYTINYKNRDPRVAEAIVASVVHQFTLQSPQFVYGQAQQLLKIYQDQLTQAKNNAAKSLGAEQQYLAAHPELTKPGFSPLNDPTYSSLDQQRLQTQSSVQNLETSIDLLTQEISLNGTGAGNLFKQLDAPLIPNQPLSRSKQYLTGGGIGLGAGLLLCIILLVVMVRRDRAVYIPRDIDKLANIPVILELPHMSVRTMTLLTERSA